MLDSLRRTRTTLRHIATLLGSIALASAASAGTQDPAAALAGSPSYSNQIIVKFKTTPPSDTMLGQSIAANNANARAAAVSTAMGVDAGYMRRVATGADVYRLDKFRSHVRSAETTARDPGGPRMSSTPKSTRCCSRWRRPMTPATTSSGTTTRARVA